MSRLVRKLVAILALRTHLWAMLVFLTALSTSAAQDAGRGGRGGRGAAAVADSTTLTPPGRQSWTADRLHLAVGDIVTVLIDERTLASANLRDAAAETRRKGLGLDVSPPSAPGAPAANTKVKMDFGQDGTSRKSGETSRNNTFQAELSARVVAISPSGMLLIRGRKRVDVDRSRQDVTLSGWIRPQDIRTGANTIESSRIADAEILYGQQGTLGNPKGGMVSRILGMLWP